MKWLRKKKLRYRAKPEKLMFVVGLELYRRASCLAALLTPRLALVPTYCLPTPSPATPLTSLSLRGAAAGQTQRVILSRVNQLPQLTLLTLATQVDFAPDCR